MKRLSLFFAAVFAALLFVSCGADIPRLDVSADFDLANLDRENWVEGEASLFDAGKSDFFARKIKFKGRGNSTWRWCEKKSLAFKFDEAQSVFGSAKAKSFVLLANYLDLSFLKNDAAFYIARRLGFEFVPKGDFVNLFYNGEDMGLYYFCEKIEAGEGRVSLGEGGILLEIDHYFDEKWKFESGVKQAPCMVKSDGGMTEGRLAEIKAQIDEIEAAVYSENPSDRETAKFIDFESFAKCFVLQIALMRNSDFSGPNSFFAALENGKLRVPTAWDFDYSFLGVAAEECYIFDILRKSDRFKREVARVWTLSGLSEGEISGYVEQRIARIKKAAKRDGKIWPPHAESGGIKPGRPLSSQNFEAACRRLKESLASSVREFETHLALGDIE